MKYKSVYTIIHPQYINLTFFAKVLSVSLSIKGFWCCFTILCFALWDRSDVAKVYVPSIDWSWTNDLPVSTVQVLGFQVCSSMPKERLHLYEPNPILLSLLMSQISRVFPGLPSLASLPYFLILTSWYILGNSLQKLYLKEQLATFSTQYFLTFIDGRYGASFHKGTTLKILWIVWQRTVSCRTAMRW